MYVLLADEQSVYRQGIKRILRHAFPALETLSAASLDTVLSTLLDRGAPALLVLSFNLPGLNRAAGIARLRVNFPMLPLVVIGNESDRQLLDAGLSQGPFSFVDRAIEANALLSVCRRVWRPEGSLSIVSRGTAADGPRLNTLTRREQDVLQYLTEGRSNKDIARQLGLQEVTIKAHLRQMFRKLDVANRTQAASLALRYGPGD